MRSAVVLQAVLGRWWQLVCFLPFVIYVVVLGGPAVANGIAVWLMGIAGWIAGVFAKDLGNWPNRSLVPGYSKTLFQMVLVCLLLIPLACGSLWTALGNPPPPFGPGLLWGTIMTLCVVRTAVSPAVLATNLAGIIGLGFYLIWAAKQAMHPVVFESLTDWRLQFPALALAALALFHIWRRLNAPLRATTRNFEAEGREPLYTKLYGLMAGLRARVWREVVVTLPLVALALLLVLLVRTGITTYHVWIVFVLACLVYSLARVVVRLATIHVPLRLLWLSGAAETRRSLGRECALAILMLGFGWLPAGLVGAAILALGMHQAAQFDGVLLVAFTTLLMIALFVGTGRRIPSTKGSLQLLAVGVFCGGLTITLIHGIELGWADRSAMVLVLAGLAVATWWAVARALARAEIVQ